jgi:DNA-binding NtrC family response regulator
MLRVLLTDDEEGFVETLAKVLRKRDMEVTVATSGPAALAAVTAVPFDVVVLDLRMPGMDGLATLAELHHRSPGVPVLLLSGHADLASARDALGAGAVDFLLKPCPIDTLVAAIEDAAERAALARELAPGGVP